MTIPAGKAIKKKATVKPLAVVGAMFGALPLANCPAYTSSTAGALSSSGLAFFPYKWLTGPFGICLAVGIRGMIHSAGGHGKSAAVWSSSLGAGILVSGHLTARVNLVSIGSFLVLASWLADLYWKRRTSTARLACITRS